MKNLIGLVVVVLIIWSIASSYNKNQAVDKVLQGHSAYSDYKESKDCSTLEPDNSYSYGSGHYAGFEWGEQGNACSGNSDSFVKGCEDYQSQEYKHETCLSQ